MSATLELTELTSGYGSSPIVHGVSLQIAPGEIFALVGKNGMGKSSLLKTILSFLPAWGGTVRINGVDATDLPPHRKRALGLAYAPQEQALFQDLSVRDNLRLGLTGDRSFEARLADVSGWFPVLTARLSQRAGTLSGGEQKMLIVARGLIAEPRGCCCSTRSPKACSPPWSTGSPKCWRRRGANGAPRCWWSNSICLSSSAWPIASRCSSAAKWWILGLSSWTPPR